MTDFSNNDWNEQDSGNTGVSPNGVQGSYSPSQIAPIIRAIRGAAKRNYVRSNAIYTTTGTATAYILTYVGAPTAYVKGEIYRVFAHIENTGPVTINVNGVGAKSLLSYRGLPLVAGEIAAGDLIEVAYDGTSFRLLSQEKNNPKFTGNLTSNTASFSTSVTIAGNTAWHAGNDGSGSTLDADLLDGQHGTYYCDLTNATGTLANARVSGSYDGIDTLTANRVRLLATNDASETSTAHAFQIGADASANLIIDNNEIVARENGVLKSLYIPGGVGTDTGLVAKGGVEYWHPSNDGSGSTLDADLLDGQHGSYYRDIGNSTGTLPDARLAASTYNMAALNLSNRLQISGSAPYISLLDTSSGELSARLSVNSNNIYLQSSSDDINFSTVFQFELDTKRGFVNGSQIHTTATILGIGTSASSARTALGLGNLATENFSDLVYTGSSANNLNFPIGTTLHVFGGSINRNAAASVYLRAGDSIVFSLEANGTALTGTWRSRGVGENGRWISMQRVQ